MAYIEGWGGGWEQSQEVQIIYSGKVAPKTLMPVFKYFPKCNQCSQNVFTLKNTLKTQI